MRATDAVAGEGRTTFTLRLGKQSWGPGLLRRYEENGHDRPLVALAAALAQSYPSKRMQGVTLGVREHPEPILTFAGDFDDRARVRLAELPSFLEEASTRLRFISWREVEAGCIRLAAELRDMLGEAELERCTLVGVPRGGLIVTGLLAYALRIPPERVRSTPWPAATRSDCPVVIVDDCGLSGIRLRETIGRMDAPRIVVALLFSHPDFRAAVEAAEPRVVAAVSGCDLRDHGAELLGEGYAAWRERWARRVPRRYHTALLDLIVFPWSEPQVRFRHPVTGEIEPNWSLAPPAPGDSSVTAKGGLRVQVVDDRPGIDRLADGVLPIEGDGDEGGVLLVNAFGNESAFLTGTAAELWRAWMSGDETTAASRVAEAYDEPVERVSADLDGLLEEVRRRGFLK